MSAIRVTRQDKIPARKAVCSSTHMSAAFDISFPVKQQSNRPEGTISHGVGQRTQILTQDNNGVGTMSTDEEAQAAQTAAGIRKSTWGDAFISRRRRVQSESGRDAAHWRGVRICCNRSIQEGRRESGREGGEGRRQKLVRPPGKSL